MRYGLCSLRLYQFGGGSCFHDLEEIAVLTMEKLEQNGPAVNDAISVCTRMCMLGILMHLMIYSAYKTTTRQNVLHVRFYYLSLSSLLILACRELFCTLSITTNTRMPFFSQRDTMLKVCAMFSCIKSSITDYYVRRCGV